MDLYRQGRSFLCSCTDKGDHSYGFIQTREITHRFIDKGDHSYGFVQTREIILMDVYRQGISLVWLYTDQGDHSYGCIQTRKITQVKIQCDRWSF